MILTGIVTIIIAYLVGSIPFSYIFARLIKGVDIRQVGTGNAGAMNTVQEIGLIPGVMVLILDIGKGSISILIARWLDVPLVFMFLAGMAAVAGHTWPVFLYFKGGKGAATTVGVLYALAPLEFTICFVIIVILVVVTRDSGLGIGTGLVLFPVVLWVFGKQWNLIFYSIALAILLLLINSAMLKQDIANVHGLKNYVFTKLPGAWKRKK